MLFYQHEFIWPQYIPDTLLLHAEQKGHHICQLTWSYMNKCYRAYEVLTSVILALRLRQGGLCEIHDQLWLQNVFQASLGYRVSHCLVKN